VQAFITTLICQKQNKTSKRKREREREKERKKERKKEEMEHCIFVNLLHTLGKLTISIGIS
jgi:hypothetical protein